jgi:hypothetical protein
VIFRYPQPKLNILPFGPLTGNLMPKVEFIGGEKMAIRGIVQEIESFGSASSAKQCERFFKRDRANVDMMINFAVRGFRS